MSVRYVLAPEAALDLVEVWHYIRKQTNTAIADHVESVIRDRIGFLAQAPGAGHMRQDLTNEDVKFFPVYSNLIVWQAGGVWVVSASTFLKMAAQPVIPRQMCILQEVEGCHAGSEQKPLTMGVRTVCSALLPANGGGQNGRRKARALDAALRGSG